MTTVENVYKMSGSSLRWVSVKFNSSKHEDNGIRFTDRPGGGKRDATPKYRRRGVERAQIFWSVFIIILYRICVTFDGIFGFFSTPPTAR